MKGFEPSKPSAWEADALPTELHSQILLVGLLGYAPRLSQFMRLVF